MFGYWLIGYMLGCTKHAQQFASQMAQQLGSGINQGFHWRDRAVQWTHDRLIAHWETIVQAGIGCVGGVPLTGAIKVGVGAATLKLIGRSVLLSTPAAGAIACAIGVGSTYVPR